ncbi:glyoxalase superfamily protein [Paracoccus cavernae]|uniref:Glyoxalase superfamily protein n=1 Tax=Paracoccus cavernae TaxID=1571207 RepID=A0ABT8DCE8_9RHOB|nr:glyoxalase superfamily protein [Paracoccus cavernae]
MHSFMDAKILAKNLRHSLASNGVERSHSECLELIAEQFGFRDWNQLSAHIAATDSRMSADNPPLPNGWKITRHTDRTFYRIGINASQPGVAQIACRVERNCGIVLPADSFGVMMQSISAAPYRGQKVALAAMIRTDDADAASLWMRVDEALGQALRFDNMLDRASDGVLRGTNEWVARRVVLDVPDNAASIHYGLLLNNHGSMRVKELNFGEAQADWPVTVGVGKMLEKPTNLVFSGQ